MTADAYEIILRDDEKDAFLAALAAAAAEDGHDPGVVPLAERALPKSEAAQLDFEPVMMTATFMVLKFTFSAVAGHVVCKTFDAWFEGKVGKELVVRDAQGRTFAVRRKGDPGYQKVLALLGAKAKP